MGISKQWTPARPIYPKDNIKSSNAVRKGETGFAPAYEKEPRPQMWYLMNEEYRRLWFQERDAYEGYQLMHSEKGEMETLKRNTILRDMTKKAPKRSELLGRRRTEKSTKKK